MTRRQAWLTILSMPMSYFPAWRADAAAKLGTATLTIPLDQWHAIVVTHGNEAIAYSAAELFDTLKGVDEAPIRRRKP